MTEYIKILNSKSAGEKVISLGKQHENGATEIVFDISEWEKEYGGDGFMSLYVKRNGDSSAYPVLLETDGSLAHWTVSATDTEASGEGSAELDYRIGETVVRSATFKTVVFQSVSEPSCDPPDAYETWVDTLVSLGDDTREYAVDALAAQIGAETAEEGAESAKTAAEAAQLGAESAEADAESAKTAAEAAKTGAENAKSAAETAKNGAVNARTAAERARTGAEAARDGAETAESGALRARSLAETAQSRAETAQSAAETAETNAETSAQSASQSAEEAEESNEAAHEAAVNASQAADDAETSANNANISAQAAQDAATSMSFATFGMDANGHLVIYRAERLGVMTFALNTNTGNLEVTI